MAKLIGKLSSIHGRKFITDTFVRTFSVVQTNYTEYFQLLKNVWEGDECVAGP